MEYEVKSLKYFIMVNAQEWLDREYPKEKREEITKLDIGNKELKGELDLSDFKNLEMLKCFNNELTNLEVSNCSNLKEIFCSSNHLTQLILPKRLDNLEILHCRDNLLTNLDFNSLNSEKLTCLIMDNNQIPSQDLTFLTPFINLEKIGGRRNLLFDFSFFGSLKSLKNMRKLKYLDISNTSISDGLEYLPESLESIKCENCLKIESELQVSKKISDGYELNTYRKQQPFYKVFKTLKGILDELSHCELDEINKNFFFNFKSGDFEFEGKFRPLTLLLQQVNKLIIEEKEREINSLELRIKELANLIKQQKEKIINAYLHFFTEKELLKELITAYLEYKKSVKQKLPATKLRKQYDKLYYELEEKIGEDKNGGGRNNF